MKWNELSERQQQTLHNAFEITVEEVLGAPEGFVLNNQSRCVDEHGVPGYREKRFPYEINCSLNMAFLVYANAIKGVEFI